MRPCAVLGSQVSGERRDSTVTGSAASQSSANIMAACKWREYATETGRKYYHNAVTKVSQWNAPQESYIPLLADSSAAQSSSIAVSTAPTTNGGAMQIKACAATTNVLANAATTNVLANAGARVKPACMTGATEDGHLTSQRTSSCSNLVAATGHYLPRSCFAEQVQPSETIDRPVVYADAVHSSPKCEGRAGYGREAEASFAGVQQSSAGTYDEQGAFKRRKLCAMLPSGMLDWAQGAQDVLQSGEGVLRMGGPSTVVPTSAHSACSTVTNAFQ
jgi:hypothetical protein